MSDLRAQFTDAEWRRLNNWKWLYRAEAAGFTRTEAEHLLFLQWRTTHSRWLANEARAAVRSSI